MECRQWSPDHTRASCICAESPFRLWNVRSVLTSCGTASLLVISVHVISVVWKYLAVASIIALEKNPCAEGYSGWFTVSRGVQLGSGSVSGLPSVSARGIAVRGLQARKKYLA